MMCVMGVATPMQPKYRLPLSTLVPWPAPNPVPCPALPMRTHRKVPMLSTALIRPASTAARPATAMARPVTAGGLSHSTSRPASAGGGTRELRSEVSGRTASLRRASAPPPRVLGTRSAQTLVRLLPPRSEHRGSGGLCLCKHVRRATVVPQSWYAYRPPACRTYPRRGAARAGCPRTVRPRHAHQSLTHRAYRMHALAPQLCTTAGASAELRAPRPPRRASRHARGRRHRARRNSIAARRRGLRRPSHRWTHGACRE